MSDNLGDLLISQRTQSLVFAALLTAGAAHGAVPTRVAYNQPQRGIYVAPMLPGSYTSGATLIEQPLNLASQLTRLVSPVDSERHVTLLAHLSGVSRKTFYGWLNGEQIKPENQERLRRTLTLLGRVSMRQRDLYAFLTTPTPAGKPADLLHADRHDVVLGLSYGVPVPPAPRTSPAGRALRSAPFITPSRETARNARRTRDIADVDVDTLAAYANQLETGPIGHAIIIA